MFVRVVEQASGKSSVRIVESVRKGKEVRQRIVRYVGQGVDSKEVETLKKLAEEAIGKIRQAGSKPLLPWQDLEKFFEKKSDEEIEDLVRIKNLKEESRFVTGISEIFGKVYSEMALDSLLFEKEKPWHWILKSCVLARLGQPASKFKTAKILDQDYGIKIAPHKIYRMMDRLFKKEDDAKTLVLQSTLTLFQQKVDVLFFDVTTLYFESVEADGLRAFGYSKDCKFKEVQVVLALVTTAEGLPITYELFAGNTSEGKTLVVMIENLQKKFQVESVVLVADRAMFNEINLSLMESKKISFVVAAKLRSMPKNVKEKILKSPSFYSTTVEGESHWLMESEWKNRRVVISYSSSRAHKDASDRQRLIDRLLKKVKGEKIPVTDLILNRRTSRFLKTSGGTAEIDQAKILNDQQWDGLHGIVTNMQSERAENLLARYRGLWQIEEAFRINKFDLKMRPIFHWTKARIHAHILICFLAFAVAKQALHRLKKKAIPMSLEQLRDELIHVQASCVRDRSTQRKYQIPSAANETQKKIYAAFGLHRSESIRRI